MGVFLVIGGVGVKDVMGVVGVVGVMSVIGVLGVRGVMGVMGVRGGVRGGVREFDIVREQKGVTEPLDKSGVGKVVVEMRGESKLVSFSFCAITATEHN
jgi:hypothetical protein